MRELSPEVQMKENEGKPRFSIKSQLLYQLSYRGDRFLPAIYTPTDWSELTI